MADLTPEEQQTLHTLVSAWWDADSSFMMTPGDPTRLTHRGLPPGGVEFGVGHLRELMRRGYLVETPGPHFSAIRLLPPAFDVFDAGDHPPAPRTGQTTA